MRGTSAASLVFAALVATSEQSLAKAIDRHSVVSRYNPTRNASSFDTPMQVGNGNFAFGADVTGLQTFLPYNIMSSWGFKNDSFPPGYTWEDVANYRGVEWDFHGRPIQYDFDGSPSALEQWLIANPNRVNLGRVGLLFYDSSGHLSNVSEGNLTHTQQKLDLWTGTITSQFFYEGEQVTITTSSAQSSDAIGISLQSPLLSSGRLGIFLDFPWNDGTEKFQAPFVGVWNATSNHTTKLETGHGLGQNAQAEITHTSVNATFYTQVGGDALRITRDSPTAHRYTLKPTSHGSSFAVSVSYSPSRNTQLPKPSVLVSESARVWQDFWVNSGFVDLVTDSSDPRADELQRRIVLSRYLMRVNEAGDNPPQESGLQGTGWRGKFHMEMTFWHMGHWALWNNWDLFSGLYRTYKSFLPNAIFRARKQGFTIGARWPKMTDPSGRTGPGEINENLIWQQPHPLVFAEYEYRNTHSRATLEKWLDIVNETANWMADFAFYNKSTGVYDLGPPMYIVSENTPPNSTRNPAFELAYWRFGLSLAETWLNRLNLKVPHAWVDVKENLAPLPIEDGLYAIFEGIESDFWTEPAIINDHPSLVGLHGWLPPIPGVNLTIAKATSDKVYGAWNQSNLWPWDFPMLAMSAARDGELDVAVDWLVNPLFEFDDVGMPVGGVRVPTPYFPGSGALLMSVAMMARGWDGSNGTAPGFPKDGWNVRVEGINPAL
ncbi:hypothetical protein BDW22DRAFT_1328504 [Trametopsis cervina]|nr:hypothetical protein BDW22DRAFT_1328504 [Trametopsis cervina]